MTQGSHVDEKQLNAVGYLSYSCKGGVTTVSFVTSSIVFRVAWITRMSLGLTVLKYDK